MNALMPLTAEQFETLPALIDRAAAALTNARTSAEVLEARDMAGVIYDAAKRAARMANAKGAHDKLIAAAHRAQADALLIESQAKRRLADEYDAAQERGEVKKAGNPNSSKTEELPGPGEIGLTYKQIHEARQIRDAEEREPGIVKRSIEERLSEGREPSRASIRRAVAPEPAPRPARGKEAICKRVSEAVAALNGLPPPHEVVKYFSGTDVRMSGVNPNLLPQVLADLATGIEGLQRHGVAKIASAGGTAEQIREVNARFADAALWLRAQEMRARSVSISAARPPCLRLVS